MGHPEARRGQLGGHWDRRGPGQPFLRGRDDTGRRVAEALARLLRSLTGNAHWLSGSAGDHALQPRRGAMVVPLSVAGRGQGLRREALRETIPPARFAALPLPGVPRSDVSELPRVGCFKQIGALTRCEYRRVGERD